YSILFKQEHAHEDAIWTAAWGRSEKDGSETIVTGSLDDLVKVWKWSDEKLELQWTLEGHQLGVVSVDISQNGAIAASSSLDAHIRLWDLETGKQIKSMDAGPENAPDAREVSALAQLEVLKQTRRMSGALQQAPLLIEIILDKMSEIIACSCHVNRRSASTVCSGPETREHRADHIRQSAQTTKVDAWAVAFSPDSKYIATGSHLGKVNIFGVESGKKEHSLDTRGKFILSIAYSPDGKHLATGAIDGIINIFDIATGKLLHTLEGHAMPIRSLTFSPDSQLLVTASDDGYIKIYDVQHANLAGTLSGHGSWVLNVAFSPDDTHFVSRQELMHFNSSDKSVKVWDTASRSCVNTFFDHQDQVWSVKYNPTGSKIVSAGDDRAIHIYDCPK
ncbi:WD repeat-containing protein 61, partial [Anabarilius grahami]